MLWYVSLIISLAFTVVSGLLTPKQKSKPSTLNDFDVPTATEDRPKPVFVGTVRHKSPNCIWYGDFSTTAIKAKVSAVAGILSFGTAYLNKQVIGYKYNLGIQLSLGWGKLDALRQITLSDKSAWTGTATSGNITINQPTLFGGSEVGGSGGFQATAVLYNGDGTQSADTYVVAKSGATPAYKNDVLLVFKGLVSGGAYVGNSASFPEISVDVSRYPNQLGVTGGKHIIDTYDANPVCALYEFMTSPDRRWGAGFSSTQFNTAGWITAANTVYAEGLGISRLWDNTEDVQNVVEDYLRLIDGVVSINAATGLIELDLARNDYDPDTILELGEDDVIEVVSFKRGSWVDTFSEVKMTYIDRTQEFASIPVAAQDGANSSGQAENRSTSIDVPGVSNPTVANKVVFRGLRKASAPLSALQIKVNRKAYQLRGASVFKWVGDRYGVESIIFRVTDVDGGVLTDGTITVTAVEDVFSLSAAAFSAPQITTWTPPVTDAVAVVTEGIFQQPLGFHGTANKSVYTVAKRPATNQQSYNLWTKKSTDSAYSLKVSNAPFTPTGTVQTTFLSGTDTTLTVVPDTDMDELPATVSQSEINNGDGLILIGSEIIAYESFTIVSGNYVFTGLHSGLYSTTPASHATSARVWFISLGAAFDPTDYPAGATVNAKLLPVTGTGELPIGSATAISVTVDSNTITGVIGGIPVDGTPSNGDVLIYDSGTGTYIPGPSTASFNIHALSAKTTPVDADELALADSAASFASKKVTWANIKATIKSYYDSVVSTLTNKTIDGGSNTITNVAQSSITNLTSDLALKAPLASPVLTGNPTAPTQTAGNNSTRIATTAYADTAIANLINSAPGVLDTLEEIADALGDDPNFAATMTTALAAKAPLASPALTGNPTAPTPTAGDNDTSIATTAFVHTAVAGVGAAFSEQTITITTASLLNGANETGTITIGREFLIKNIVADRNAEIRFYGTAAARTADASRAFGNLSFIGQQSKYICGVKLTGTTGLTWSMSPPAYGQNADGPTSATIYYSITNNSGSTHSVVVTLKVLILEV